PGAVRRQVVLEVEVDAPAQRARPADRPTLDADERVLASWTLDPEGLSFLVHRLILRSPDGRCIPHEGEGSPGQRNQLKPTTGARAHGRGSTEIPSTTMSVSRPDRTSAGEHRPGAGGSQLPRLDSNQQPSG